MHFEQLYRNKSVLITGGCGFIGSHIAEALVQLQARVTILDDLSTGSLHNIASIRNKIDFIQGSITDLACCMRAAQNVDIIFHLAAMVSVQQSMEQSALCHAINVQGTINVLEAARAYRVKRLLLASSSAVYGINNNACSEETPCKPTSVYGFSKFFAEYACKEYADIFNCSTLILRYFNVYGPRQRAHGSYTAALTHFRSCMEQNIPITIFGDGMQTRDFVAVSTVVQANLFFGIISDHALTSNIFNIASGKSISLLAAIEQLKTEYPWYNQPLVFYPARPGDIRNSQAVCTKYQQLYNSHTFVPPIDSLANQNFML
jgi:UDP-glucose 4-epimerase